MEKTVKKLIKTGYGLGLLSLEEAKKAAAKLKKELNLSEKESLRLARELVAGSEKLSRGIIGMAKKHFECALKRAGVAHKKEFNAAKKTIEKRVSKLKTRVRSRLRRAAK